MEPVSVDKQYRGCMPRYPDKLTSFGCMAEEENMLAMRYAYRAIYIVKTQTVNVLVFPSVVATHLRAQYLLFL